MVVDELDRQISAEPLVVRTRSVIVLSRLVHRPDSLPPPTSPSRFTAAAGPVPGE